MKMGLFVDYQHDFVAGSLGFPGAELLDEGLVAWARVSWLRVVSSSKRPTLILPII